MSESEKSKGSKNHFLLIFSTGENESGLGGIRTRVAGSKGQKHYFKKNVLTYTFISTPFGDYPGLFSPVEHVKEHV